MGQAIAKIAEERGHTISKTIDLDNKDSLKTWSPNQVDVAIEFTAPSEAYDNIGQCIKLGIPVVSGTTGWLDKKPEIDQLCTEKGGTYFYASNYSLGVNITFKVNEYLARIMNGYPDFQVSMEETHHTQKKDAPSGTAITLAEGIIDKIQRLEQWELAANPGHETLTINSLREGAVPGTHKVQYLSPYDEITLQHKALNRTGFALGAVLVTEWIQNRKGILTMDDFLEL